MRTTLFNSRRDDRGSTLLIALFVAMILGMALASYLTLVRAQNVAVARSQAWNTALVVAEAGIEEALAQLNSSGAVKPPTFAANGWALDDGLYQPNPPCRDLLNGRFCVAYSSTTPPVIYSTGYTTLPALSAPISRTIKVTTAVAPLFSTAVVLGKNADLGRKDLFADSFDSADSRFSKPPGVYDPSRSKTNGHVASVLGFTNMGKLTVRGKLLVGAATASLGTNCSVSLGTEKDFNAELPDVAPPFSTGLPLTKSSGAYTLASGNYLVPGNLVLSSRERLQVGTNCSAVLYVKGTVSMNKAAEIRVPPGSSLQLYVAGPSAKLGVVNNFGNCRAFQYYGLPGNTSVTLPDSNSSFAGTIYAPNADLTLGGGVASFLNFQGSLAVKKLTALGDLQFHYDEDLARRGPVRGFVVTGWQELSAR